MSLIWGLAFPLLTHLSLMLLGFLVCGIWVLFSRYQSQTKVAAKTEAPGQQNTSLKQIRKLTVSQLEETEMNVIAADLTRISGLPTNWTEEYVFWSIDRSLRQIFKHLDNARSTLMELNVSESRDVTSSSVSDAVVQEAVPPSCYCKKGKPSTDYSMSSASSNNSSSLSYLPMFHEGTAWQFQSDSGPVSSQKEPSMPRSPGTALPTSRLTDPEKSALSPNLALLPPLQAQTSFISSILESLDPCEQEKTKDKGKTHFQSNHGSDSDLDESPGPLVGAPLQLSPLIRGELEGHMSQKASTLQQEVVPLPVKKSWNILNHLMDVQGVPEEELPETQLPTLIPQSAKQNTNTSPDPPSFHLHMNIGVNSEVHRMEAIISQPFPSNKQSQPQDDRQEPRYNPLVISTGTPSPRNLEVNIIQEEQALVKKDSKHVLELNIEQKVIGLPEKRVQTHKELTPKIPPSATDSIKVTPLALLQVMDLMGINPEPQSEVIDSVGFSPQPPNQAETVSITPQPLNEVTEPIEVTHHQHQTTGLKSMASRLSQVTDDMKVTPVALFHVTDSMGMIDKLSPHGIEPVGIAPEPQYQVMESVKMDTLHNYQAIRPGSMSRGPQQTLVEAVEMIPQPQHKDMGTLTMTLGSQNQATKHIRITPSPVHENAMEISSGALPEATEDKKVSPVAKQAMDFMQMIPLGQPHITKSRALIRVSQPPAENLTPVSAQPDVPTTTVPVGTLESRIIPPQPPSKVLEPSGMTDDLLPSGQSLHALKVIPLVQASPTEMIIPRQIVEPQIKEALELPSGLQGQVGDSVGTMPQSRGTECVSLTPGMSHQVTDPSEFTPWHQDLNCSEVSPRQSHNMTETMGLNWPQVKDPMETPQSHHQIMESRRKIPAPPDQGAVPIGRGLKHQVPEDEVGPVIPLLQEMEYLGGSTIPQSKVRDSVDLPPELQNVKSDHLILDPRSQSMKSVDITTDLVPEMEKYGPPTSTVVCIDLAPELHQQNMQYEELTPIPQLQSETSVPLAPESQFQDVKSGQLTVEPQLQNKKSDELTPCPQLHSNVSVHLISDSQSQGMEEALLALSQEIQGDIKMVELTPRPSLEDIKSVNLAPEPCSQSTSSDKIAPVPLLEDTKTPFVEGRSLLPEAQVESMEVGELIPSTQFYATKSLEAIPKPSYHFLEPEGPTLQHPASEARVTSELCRQVEESAPLPQSSLGMSPAPLSQTSESVEMSSPPLQNTLEPGTQVVKEMEETPETGRAIKDTLDLLLDSEVQTMSSGVMAPEPQPPDVKFVQVTLEPGLEVTNPPERTLKPEDEDTETFRLTFSKADDTQGTITDLYSEVRSLEFSLEPGVQGEQSESFAQNLKSAEVITEPPVQVVEPAGLTTGPKPHIKDVIPRLQVQEIKSRQMDSESQLQNENSVNVIQPSSAGEVDPEKTKPEPRLQSLSPKEWFEGTQSPNVKSVDLNLGPQQLSVKSKLIPGPKFQSVQFPMLYQGLLLQGENPVNFISGPPHYGVKSDDEISCSLGPETKSSDFILGPKLPEPQPQPQPGKSVDVNIRPCLHHVRFSDAIPEAKHQGFKCVQFMPDVQLQDRKPQALMPESFLPLSQETQVEDKKLGLPPELSEFCSMKRPIPASELQHPRVIAKLVNPGLWHQDTQFSELASRRKYQRVKFGEQTPGSLSHGMSPMAPELGIHDPKSAKVTPGLQDTRQVSFNSGPRLQDVQFLYAIPGTQPQGVKTSKLNSGPQLECVKMFELTPQPERQGMKPELIVQEPPFKDIKYVTRNLVPNFEGKMSYKLASEPQIPNAESKKLTPGKHLAGAESSTLIHRQHLGHIKPVEKITASKKEDLTPGPHLEDVKSMELRSKSELGKIMSMLSTPGIQAGDKEREELPPCSTLKGLKSELPPSGPQLEDRKSAVLTLGQCLERIKSTVISPSSSQSDGMKSVKLIPGSRIQDLITVGLARDAPVQDINAMGLEREPKKQGESPGTFAPGMLFQDKPMEVLQEPHQHNVKPMELTSRPQTQDSKRVIVSCLKQQSLKPVKKAKTQGIQGVKFMDLVSTQQYQGRAPMDLTLEPGRDDHISSAEWKGGMFDQVNKQLESEDILSLGSDQEPKPASRKPIELSSKLQCKDAPSFELAPEPVVHNVKAQEVQCGPQVLSMKPCPLIPESEVYQVKSVKLKPGSPTPSVNPLEFTPCHCSQRTKTSFAQKPCVHERKPMQLRLGSQQQSMDCQQFPLNEKPVVSTPESMGNFLAGPALSSVKFSNLIPESQQQCMKSMELASEPKWQSVNHLKLSSVSLPQTGTSVGLSPRPFLQNVTPGNQNPQTCDQIIESSQVIYRPGHQLEDYAEKMRHQLSKLVDFISLPVSQDAGSSEMTKVLGHKSPETTEKNMRLTPKPTDQDIESLGMPQQLDLQGPESVDLTPTLSDPDWKSSELTPQKGYWSPETLQLLPCLWPQFKDYKELPTEQATGSDRMTLDLKNHVAEVRMLTCEVRPGKEFLSVPSKPVNRETGHVEKSPRPCPQDLGPVVVSSGKRAQREQSVASPPRPSYPVPDSVSGITPGHGPQIPESVSLTSKPWLQIEEFLELSTQQTSQLAEDTDFEELTFESWQPGEGASRLTKTQNASMGTLNITPIESLDQMINFITISPKPLNQVTESTKTQVHISQSAALPKVSESVEVISGPPLQVIESVMIPEPASQGSKHADLTPKLHDVIMSEFASSLWLQNVQSKKLIAAPTHQILETIQLSGFQVIKTILVPKPLLLIVKSEELAPGPNPQAMEPIGVATKSSIKVMDGLNLLPRPHLQDMVKPTEQTPRANIQENFAELILQQTSPLEEPPVLTHEQRLQAEKSLGIRTESPKVMKIEDLNQRRVSEERDSEMITSEKLQEQNYFSRFIPSPSIPLISSSVKTTELWPLQGSGMSEVSRALAMKNLAVGILPSPESYTDTIMFRSSALPLVLPSDIGNTVGSLYSDIWEVDILSKEAIEKKQMREFENSFQSYSPYPLRLLPSEFQAGLGARRNSIRSFLGRQQNVWESHVCRQRLPRKYLSTMLMMGNVLGTTMERKLCSQPFLTEEATMDMCQFIQSLFGVPAELMAFSQSPLERGPRTISQTSVVRNYIQRHILCHGHEKRMPLKMWTRGSTSSIIQQYSGTRLGIKKTNSKLSDIFQEVTQNVSVSCTRAQFPALMKPESSLKILYNREDAVSSDQSKDSQSESQTRPSDSHHSLKASCPSQAKRDISEQLHLLKDLQLKIAAKLLESQVPHNVPPPFSSGLVLKYPICLQCGRCSGINCCHKLQSAFGPYLLIYPQIHLLSTPESHGEIRLHLGFRLRTGKRPQVSKHRGRKRADAWKSTTSPSRRKAKIYRPASKSPTTPRDFQARSSQATASVQVHIRKKQSGSHGVVGKTDTEDFEHHEFCQVHSVSESGFESSQEEKWSKSSLKKTFGLKHPMKETIKGLKKKKTNLYKNSGTPEESPFRIMCPSRSKSVETVQTSTASSKTQPKKSSQPKFYHLLFQGLRQAFQIAHRIVAYTGQKPADRTRPDNLWSTQYLHPKQKPSKYCLAGDGKGASTPVAHQKSAGVNPKQEDRLQGTGDQCRQTQQPKQVSSLQPRPLQLETMASERDATFQVTSVIQPLSIVQNVNGRAKNNYGDEISCLESKNCSQVGAKCQAQERIEPDSHLKRSLQSDFKKTHTPKEEQHGFFRERDLHNKSFERTNRILLERIHESLSERRYCSPSQRRHSSPSDRMLRHLSERRHCNPSQRQDSSPSVRTLQSISDWSLYSLCKGVGLSPSGRSRPNPGRRPRSPSRRSLSPRERRGRERRGHSPSKRCHLSPLQRTRCSPSERSHGSLSERTPFSPSGRKRHNSSGRVHHLPSESRLYRSSSRLHRNHSERTHYSPFEIRHSYSERSRQGHNEGPHHSTKERLRGKEKPRHSLSIKTSRLINS
ncbi:uncharacterized protein LOC143270077 [Peromyscus maniculatus bairdii]|uniref:uncharacterized protein LOC143270077 n=1 Tax=Peromyscus maniculatus bairdii TaxID=230844 RepID=UPI003FD133CC